MKYQKRYLSSRVLEAQVLLGRPACIPQGRPRGAKAEGLRYEGALFKAGGEGIRGQWFKYWDEEGEFFCQTDILLRRPGGVWVLECKLTWTPEGEADLRRLYLPVVQKALGCEVRGVVCCENLRRGMPFTTKIVSTLDEALASRWPGGTVLNWRRKTPLRIAVGAVGRQVA